MIDFVFKKIENASPFRQRMLEQIINTLAGYDNDLALTVGTNILVQAVTLESEGVDAKTDELIDQIAVALKQACRLQKKRMRQ